MRAHKRGGSPLLLSPLRAQPCSGRSAAAPMAPPRMRVRDQLADEGMHEMFSEAREGPIAANETWADALPPEARGAVFLTAFGLQFGQSRIQATNFGPQNRTDWWRPREGFLKDWFHTAGGASTGGFVPGKDVVVPCAPGPAAAERVHSHRGAEMPPSSALTRPLRVLPPEPADASPWFGKGGREACRYDPDRPTQARRALTRRSSAAAGRAPSADARWSRRLSLPLTTPCPDPALLRGFNRPLRPAEPAEEDHLSLPQPLGLRAAGCVEGEEARPRPLRRAARRRVLPGARRAGGRIRAAGTGGPRAQLRAAVRQRQRHALLRRGAVVPGVRGGASGGRDPGHPGRPRAGGAEGPGDAAAGVLRVPRRRAELRARKLQGVLGGVVRWERRAPACAAVLHVTPQPELWSAWVAARSFM